MTEETKVENKIQTNQIWEEERNSGDYVYPPGVLPNFHDMDLDDPDLCALIVRTDRKLLRLEITESPMDMSEEWMVAFAEREEKAEKMRETFRVIK